jgi:hypothetical protein
MSRRISTLDLSIVEQEHVRNALMLLRTKFETWARLAKLLKFDETTVVKSAHGSRTIMASMALRTARLADVSIDDLLAGRYPARGCPRCGYDPRAKVKS